MKITLEMLYNNGFIHENPEDRNSELSKLTEEYNIYLSPYTVIGTNTITFDIYAEKLDDERKVEKTMKAQSIGDTEQFTYELKNIGIDISLNV